MSLSLNELMQPGHYLCLTIGPSKYHEWFQLFHCHRSALCDSWKNILRVELPITYHLNPTSSNLHFRQNKTNSWQTLMLWLIRANSHICRRSPWWFKRWWNSIRAGPNKGRTDPTDLLHKDQARLNLTLLVLRLGYARKTRSIPWLLMPWLLASPGHQQPWYWLLNDRIGPCLLWGFQI